MVDTKHCLRRQVTYGSLDDVVADAKRLVAAGAITTGNWSMGQILKHIAVVMDKSIDGFDLQAPLPMRLVGRWILKKRFLRDGMPPGFQLKNTAAKELLPKEVDSAEALEHLQRAAARLKNETSRCNHPFFGPMSQDESNRINCRHAELHMSFIAEPTGE